MQLKHGAPVVDSENIRLLLLFFVFWGDEPTGYDGLHNVSTHDIDRKVHLMFKVLLSGDMVAIKAKYHKKYLAGLYKQARASSSKCAS